MVVVVVGMIPVGGYTTIITIITNSSTTSITIACTATEATEIWTRRMILVLRSE